MCSSALLAVESPIAEPSTVMSISFPSIQNESISLHLIRIVKSIIIETNKFICIDLIDSQIHGLCICGYLYGGIAVKTYHLRIYPAQRIILSISFQFIGFPGRYSFVDIRVYRVSSISF